MNFMPGREVGFLKIRTFVFFLITGLAAIGLLSFFAGSPNALGKRILFLIFVASLLYIVYRMGIKKPVRKDQQAFLRAAKKSKKRIRKRQSSRLSTQKRKPIRRRNDVHLTVIEGKKGKKKKRA
jgi:hypothetical protein